MRLLKESVLQIWKARKAAVREELTLLRIEIFAERLWSPASEPELRRRLAREALQQERIRPRSPR
jgi:hypothetical protein